MISARLKKHRRGCILSRPAVIRNGLAPSKDSISNASFDTRVQEIQGSDDGGAKRDEKAGTIVGVSYNQRSDTSKETYSMTKTINMRKKAGKIGFRIMVCSVGG